MEEKKIKISLNEGTVFELKGRQVEIFLWVWKKYGIWDRAMELKPGFLGIHFDSKNDVGNFEIHYFGKETIDKQLSP